MQSERSETTPKRGVKADDDKLSYRGRIRSTVGNLATKMNRHVEQGDFGTGELAELRRLDAAQGASSTSLTFWRIVVGELEERDLIGASSDAEAIRPWISILRAMAELAGHHRPGWSLGRALHGAGVSEMRLVRLLRAEGRDLAEQLRPLTHQLRGSGADVDLRELAELVLSDASRARGGSSEWNERIRRKIASAYFRADKRSEAPTTDD